ncbi:MAG: hypothetical protein V1794_16250 [Candidatus Glassbacteria bacterium]
MKKTGEERTGRLLDHLEMGGTRKGACGRAEMAWSEFNRQLEEEAGFAELVETAEAVGLSRDEQRLNTSVEDGDRPSLLFRLRTAYTRDLKPGREAGRRKTDERNEKFDQIRREICCLTPGERKELSKAVKANSELAAAGA